MTAKTHDFPDKNISAVVMLLFSVISAPFQTLTATFKAYPRFLFYQLLQYFLPITIYSRLNT
ncbi:hypothetical protein K450DRAFT_216696 [Umbelopsis ramanniana AG]|uniref:Uncharacterized protein n=1 Tax=Umbelopsis ramanniana AG TaxID=1314678 RepID=A0AAD5EJV8_UMBRA|nr:uncharacterized protein K450DRAFT_216696 [Umbelopsis ramanniana AG]KAI8584510.1 hypothetical protein K450DRAFT_216696 [Umbelopsis ramanniana AG]